MGLHDQDRKTAFKKSEGKYFFIRSFAKGMKVLEFLSDNEALTVTQVAKLMHINRVTTIFSRAMHAACVPGFR